MPDPHPPIHNAGHSVSAEPARDPLTGLPDAAAVAMRLGGWLASGTQHVRGTVHGLLIGLRRLDAVNLAYGEAAGDGALVTVASRLMHFAADELDGEWIAARWGGSAFVLLSNEPCSRERWQWLAEMLAETVAAPIAGSTGTMRLSPRVALLRALPGEDADAIFDRLSQTLALVQRQPARRVLWADGETSLTGRSAAQLEADLLRALDRDEIEVLYQPQFALADDRLTGAEALARWQHPALGRIGAAALFAIAERADHVAQLSQHIARRALAGAAGWPHDLRLSLNVTAADLTQPAFAADMAALVAQSGFPASRLTLEVTEQALVVDLERVAGQLEDIAATGVCLALDDFGAGFCNFRYLKLLPLHLLKLDRAMIDGIASDPRDLAVLRAIVAMARALGLRVIAEGIETEEQRALVAAEGCDSYQGFLRAQPMSGAEFAALAAA